MGYYIITDKECVMHDGMIYKVFDDSDCKFKDLEYSHIYDSSILNIVPCGAGKKVNHPFKGYSDIMGWRKSQELRIVSYSSNDSFRVVYGDYKTDFRLKVSFIVSILKTCNITLFSSNAKFLLKYLEPLDNNCPVTSCVMVSDRKYGISVKPFGYSDVYDVYAVLCRFDTTMEVSHFLLYFCRGRLIGCSCRGLATVECKIFKEPDESYLSSLSGLELVNGVVLTGITD